MNKARTTKRKISIADIIGAVIALYILGSFCEVNTHNGIDDEPLKNPYNAFYILSEALNKNT